MFLSYERLLNRFSDDNFINKIKKELQVKRLVSVVILSTIMPLSFTSVTMEDDKTDKPIDSKIGLNIETPYVLAAENKKSSIKPGESKVQKDNRIAKEKAEAEAKARAEAEAKAAAERSVVTRERRVYNDPSNFDSIYQRAQAAYGVDARLLKAVHTVETGRSGSTSVTSYAGAQGPMQFLPSTWRSYGVDGNGDGRADINNVEDAIFTAAKYLKACGYPNVKKALWGYNPSTSYYNKVMSVARSFGFNG